MTRIGHWVAAGALAAATSLALGDYFAPGADNGWDISGATSAMTETGIGTGIWEYTATGGTPGTRTSWNIVDIAGDWGSQVYSSDQWGFYDGTGEVTVTLDTNTYNDGWLPSTNRVSTSTAGNQNWVVTGNWVFAAGLGNDWDLGTAPAMNAGGGGVFELTVTGLAPGTYAWKAVANPSDGNWDTITEDVSTTVAGADNTFDIFDPSDVIVMQINTANGTARSIPTPGAMALVGLGGIAATRRRRR